MSYICDALLHWNQTGHFLKPQGVFGDSKDQKAYFKCKGCQAILSSIYSLSMWWWLFYLHYYLRRPPSSRVNISYWLLQQLNYLFVLFATHSVRYWTEFFEDQWHKIFDVGGQKLVSLETARNNRFCVSTISGNDPLHTCIRHT